MVPVKLEINLRPDETVKENDYPNHRSYEAARMLRFYADYPEETDEDDKSTSNLSSAKAAQLPVTVEKHTELTAPYPADKTKKPAERGWFQYGVKKI